MHPRFSIITATYNARKEIGSTMKSILDQTFENYEWIIQDGCSTDDTLANIPSNENIYTFVEKDCGVYDAMNKAISHVNGEYVIFMNAGDCFSDEKVLESLNEFIINTPSSKEDVLFGDYITEGRYVRQKAHIKQIDLYRKPLCHQSIIYPTHILRRFSGFDLIYKICADHDLTVRMWKNKINLHHIDLLVCSYLGGGLSQKQINLTKKEKKELLQHHFSGVKHFVYYSIICNIIPAIKSLQRR